MTDLIVPHGYGTATRRLAAEVRPWLLEHHHPEYVARLVAWLAKQDGLIGVGGGWRAVQPDRPGFAPKGRSFHGDQRFASGFVGAAAVDLVARNGNAGHRAPSWDEVPRQGSTEATRWGIHCNVGGESWHCQPIEIDGWRSWVDNGRPDPRAGYPFPGRGQAPPPPGPAPASDPDRMSLPPPTLRQGDQGDRVRWLQAILGVERDGVFGPRTADAVRSVQRNLGLTQDAVYGPQTGRALERWRASVGLPKP